MYWKNHWASLLEMFMICLLALFVIHVATYKTTFEPQPTKISMVQISNPRILFVSESENSSSSIQALTLLFQKNVQEMGKFEMYFNVTMDSVLLTIANQDIITYNENVVAAFEVFENKNTNHIKVQVFYSRNIRNSVVIALNIATNALKQFYKSENNTKIDVINAPLLKTDLPKNLTLLLYVNIVPFAFTLALFIFLKWPFNEHWTRSKQIQTISHYFYWLGNFTSDIIVLAVLCGFLVTLSIILDRDTTFTIDEYGM
jgi:hypothetical protein